MDDRLGRWNFWIMFVGFNLGFFPMHVAGLLGMPRRIYTYGDTMGWNWVNLITTAGSFLFGFGVLLFIWNVAKSLKAGEIAGDNPWDAPTLEWATPSPPPPYNFAVVPTVASRHPLWEDRLQESEARSRLDRGMTLEEGKEALSTTALDAEPDRILEMPQDSYAPLLLALGMAVLFTGMLLINWPTTSVGAIGVTMARLLWLWPRRELRERAPEPDAGAAHG